MLILGIDPGTATTGYGLIEKKSSGFAVIDWGLIETDKKYSDPKRLSIIYTQMLALFRKYSPDVMAIERIFFATNAKTAINVGQALGVMLLAAVKSKVEIEQYAPGTIKKMITGDGRADKKKMQIELRKRLGNQVKSAKKKKTHFDNAADGLAVALCHVLTERG